MSAIDMSQEAMKLALEALELEEAQTAYPGRWLTNAITSLREALNASLAEQPAPATELREQEPVAWISKHGVVYPLDAKDEVHPINELQPLYTSPPAQRKPLTDEEIEDIWADCPADWDDKINVLTLARAIEAAHDIKENT